MSTNTTHYNLVKPTEATDFVDIDVINANMDTIDAQMKANAEHGALNSFTCSLDASTGTAPTIGNGSITAKYSQIGKLVFFDILVSFGSTSNFGSAGNVWTFSLPVPPAHSNNASVGIVRGPSDRMWLAVTYGGGDKLRISDGTPSSSIGSSTLAWGPNSVLHISGCYLAS